MLVVMALASQAGTLHGHHVRMTVLNFYSKGAQGTSSRGCSHRIG